MDQILINDLLVHAIVGVNPEERTQPQDICINIALFTDTRRAGASDDIADTVSYSAVAKKVSAHTMQAARFTVEALAEDIARLCLQEPGIQSVRVRVEKPQAVRAARSVGVEIERSR